MAANLDKYFGTIGADGAITSYPELATDGTVPSHPPMGTRTFGKRWIALTGNEPVGFLDELRQYAEGSENGSPTDSGDSVTHTRAKR